MTMNVQKRQLDLVLFQQYTHSWLTKDIMQFKTLLADEIQVTECFGASYLGKAECASWFQHWNSNERNQVIKWQMLNHYYDDLLDTSTFEWFFSYTYQGDKKYFTGITLFKVSNDKIVFLKEFEAKTDTYHPFKKKD